MSRTSARRICAVLAGAAVLVAVPAGCATSARPPAAPVPSTSQPASVTSTPAAQQNWTRVTHPATGASFELIAPVDEQPVEKDGLTIYTYSSLAIPRSSVGVSITQLPPGYGVDLPGAVQNLSTELRATLPPIAPVTVNGHDGVEARIDSPGSGTAFVRIFGTPTHQITVIVFGAPERMEPVAQRVFTSLTIP